MTEAMDRLSAALQGRYTLVRELGEGGMAKVYLAEDQRHQRQVAIKVLKPELAAVLGAERFVQEITTTAQLQHPHILPLFDSGTADGFLFYVMPYVEGETLRDKLNRETQLGVEEAVRITREVADALDYAHRRGVVHRDIKPENILLHDGRPMVADFGIALAVSAAAGGRMTETGMSLGTPYYMSPEQATADKDLTGRSDVYSLASVLYEMLSGNPPHVGSSAQQIIVRIIADEARPVESVRKSVPPNVAAAVAKALEKLPADRFDSAKAFADALADPGFTPVGVSRTTTAVGGARPGTPWRSVALVSQGVAAVAVAVAAWGWLRPAAEPAMTQREIVLGANGTSPGMVQGGVAIAPDGSAIVYVDTSAVGEPQLMLKERDRLAPRVLATLQGQYPPGPSFSPDGQSIAFADGKLYRVSRSGGAPVLLSDSSVASATAWLQDGTILAQARGGAALYATPSSGGETRRLLTVDSTGYSFARLSSIPGADAGLVTVFGANPRLEVVDARTGTTQVVQTDAIGGWVVGTRLLFLKASGALFSVAFDSRRLTTSGAAVAVLDSVRTASAALAAGDIAVGADGTVIYLRRGPRSAGGGRRLALVTMDGSAHVVDPSQTIPASPLGGLDLSPDGQRVAVSVTDSTSGRGDIWVYSMDGGPGTRFTFEGQNNLRPRWSPDGTRILYVSDAGGGALRLWVKAADGSGTPSLLTEVGGVYGAEWSPDGGWIVYRTDAAVTESRDIFAVRTDGDTTTVPIAATPAQEFAPAISPDGRWLAYSSDVNGSDQIFVRPFPEAAGGVWQVSRGVGLVPRWSRDGRTIFYQNMRGQMLAADVRTSPNFQVEGERVLFSGPYVAYPYHHSYDVTPDDRGFVMIQYPLSEMGAGGRLIEIDHLRLDGDGRGGGS